MKKFFTLSMTMILMLVLSVSAFAESNEPTNPVKEEPMAEPGEESTPVVHSDVSLLQTYTLNWTLSANKKTYGSSRFNMAKGNTINFNLKWSPQPDTLAVGLYNHDTGEYHWLKNSSSSPYKNSISAPKTGLYSFALHNTSSTTSITLDGSSSWFEY